MKKKILIIFLGMVGVSLALVFGVFSRAYPVASVNDSLILARTFERARFVIERYYFEGGSLQDPLDKLRVRQVALQALIEDSLIADELYRHYEKAGVEAVLKKKVADALSSARSDIEQAVQDLFKISLKEFSHVVLLPQARIELLSEYLATQNINFEDWLRKELLQARVDIIMSDFVWRQGRVEISEEQSYTAEAKSLLEKIASSSRQFEDESEAQ